MWLAIITRCWNCSSLFSGLLRAALRGRRALLLENLLLRQQLAVALRARRRPRVRWHDRLFWVVARRLVTDWRRHLVLVQPETVLRWHRQGWRLFWWWRSRRPTGRPRLPPEVRDLIRRLSEENRLWGTERIRGELLKLGIAVGNGSIRRYRWRPAPRPPSQTWGTFLRNHAHAIWAADLLTVQTLTFRTLYVLFFITHGRRELVHVAVTAHPTAAWVWRQLIEATPWGRQPHVPRPGSRPRVRRRLRLPRQGHGHPAAGGASSSGAASGTAAMAAAVPRASATASSADRAWPAARPATASVKGVRREA